MSEDLSRIESGFNQAIKAEPWGINN